LGVRYDEAHIDLNDVIAPPYDVISPDEQSELEARSQYNAVHIELPRAEGGVDRYDVAANYWQQWRDAGILKQEKRPALYGYRMTFTDDRNASRRTLGVIGALALADREPGDVLPHERTTPKPKGDRLYLLRATGVNTSPIWGLSPAAGLTGTIPVPTQTGAVTDDEGVIHELWPITDPPAIERIAAKVSGAPVIIADGHHRYETGLSYHQEHPDAAGAAAVMALIVELADDQLSVQAIHRLISGLPTGFDLPAAMAPFFALEPTAPPDESITARLVTANALALHTAAGTWLLHPRPETERAAEQDLDSSRLDLALATLPEHDLVFQHGWEQATGAVDASRADAAILLRPATVAQIAATGREGMRMPPKTTFFWPKPRTGLVFRAVREVAG
jgi:uncharacterized protein (DUF1015 family)